MTVIALPPCEPGSPEWHEQRAHAIGGSEAAACCGLDPYTSPFALWCLKRGLIPPEDDTEAMAWGRRMEDPIAREWAERRDLFVVRPPGALVFDEVPWMHANVDRFVYESQRAAIDDDAEPLGVLETKLSHDVDRWRDGPPDHHVLQVQHYLAVTGLETGWLVGLLSARSFRLVTYEIERDELLIERLVRAEHEMMRRIDEGDPPAASPGDADVLAEAFADPEPGARVELPPTARVVLDELARSRELRSLADEDVKRMENQLRAWLGEAEIGTFRGDVAVTWKAHDASRLDVSALRADLPDIASEYTRRSSQRRLVVKQ